MYYYCNNWYYGTANVFVDERLDYCQAGIKYTDYGECLYSYSTIVICYDKNKEELNCNGLYSATTRKHIGRYIKRFNYLNYYDIKALTELNSRTCTSWVIKNPNVPEWFYFNIETGQCIYPYELKITAKKIKYKLRSTENWYSLT